jgi:hypothetical protein
VAKKSIDAMLAAAPNATVSRMRMMLAPVAADYGPASGRPVAMQHK